MEPETKKALLLLRDVCARGLRVVTAQPDTRRESETFGFRCRIDHGLPLELPFPGFDPTQSPIAGAGPDPEEAGTGGCSTASSHASLALLLLILAPIALRRRRVPV